MGLAAPATALAQVLPPTAKPDAEKPNSKPDLTTRAEAAFKPDAPKEAPPRPIVVLLSVDGGGIRGIAAAAILREIDRVFQNYELDLIDCIDVFAGTSTGSIIAAGMAASKDRTLPYWRPQAIIDIYKNQGARIFGPKTQRSLIDWSRQRWDSSGLEAILADTFGDRMLRDLPGNLIVPYYNMEATNGKSAVVALGGGLCDKTESRSRHRVRDVVSASASAPTYFNPHRVADGALGVDGGVFANNPAMTAWVATQRWIRLQDRYAQAEIYVISIGCGSRSVRYPRNTTWGPVEWMQFWGDGPPIIDVLMRGQSDLVHSQMTELMVPRKNYFRFQFDLPTAAPGQHQIGALDDVSPYNLQALEHLGDAACQTPEAQAMIRDMARTVQQVRRQIENDPSRALPNTTENPALTPA